MVEDRQLKPAGRQPTGNHAKLGSYQPKPTDLTMAHTLRCTFLAQEWIGDTAHPVRRENPPTWACVVDTIPEPFSHGSDYLRFMGAPQWAQDWDGPFEVDFELAVD